MWNRKVFIRIVEVVLCLACVVALRVTDDESRRVFHYLRSRSREWSLLNNVTWGAIGAALATATCGGYIIITTGLLIAAATGELAGRKTELFFLGLGIILFGIVGALSLASIENVPEDLVDNAAVFGALCILTALVFIADLLMGSPKKKISQGMTELSSKKAKCSPVAASIGHSRNGTWPPPRTNGWRARGRHLLQATLSWLPFFRKMAARSHMRRMPLYRDRTNVAPPPARCRNTGQRRR